MVLDKVLVLEMKGISKSFGAVKAVQDVDLTLYSGEILGLVGDNAAGKSTLMKVLSGVHRPEKGKICIEGKEVHIENPHQARDLGIEMIYQDFALAPNLSVVDNIFLGREENRTFGVIRFLNRAKMYKEAEHALESTNIRIDNVKTAINQLSGGQMQAVAIARATAFGAKILVMDEPTASLSVKAIPQLLDLMLNLKSIGTPIIFITHRLQDIFQVCNRVMVLRRGVRAGVANIEDTNMDEVTGLITGAKDTFNSIDS
jgi:ABC-type sugar transport system ATPase subunit